MIERPHFPPTLTLPRMARDWIEWANDHIYDLEEEVNTLRYELETQRTQAQEHNQRLVEKIERLTDLIESRPTEVHHHYHVTAGVTDEQADRIIQQTKKLSR